MILKVFIFYKKLNLIACDPIQAVYSKESCPNKMEVLPNVLKLALENFPSNLSEVTLLMDKGSVGLKSFIETSVLIFFISIT